MKKSVLKIALFAFIFVLISCSKNSELQDKNNLLTEEQALIQEETTQIETSKLDDTSQNESDIQLIRKEDDGKDYTKEYFKDYFDDLITNYEFYIRNPLFVDTPGLYFEKPELMKNKILKMSYESYDIESDGTKHWADSYDRNVGYYYYFFDSDFRITDKYFVDKTDNSNLMNRYHTTYKCTKNNYVVDKNPQNDFNPYQKREISVYSIKKIDDGLILEDVKKNEKMVFRKNEIIKEVKNNTYIYKLDKSIIMISDNYSEIKYDGGQIISQLFSKKFGQRYFYENLDGNNYIMYYEENGEQGTISEPSWLVERRYNPIGFMEYEFEQPYESVEGSYSIMTAEILDEPDELFKDAFDEGWYD